MLDRLRAHGAALQRVPERATTAGSPPVWPPVCTFPQGTASTLTRSEVRGGGKKPFAQKGTGNARRGSSVSPLFPGGGVIFGPKVRRWWSVVPLAAALPSQAEIEQAAKMVSAGRLCVAATTAATRAPLPKPDPGPCALLLPLGPQPKDWSISMNKKERRLAMATAIQSAAADMIVVESMDGQIADKKTKSLLAALEKVGARTRGTRRVHLRSP